jgi:hypothetical protein
MKTIWAASRGEYSDYRVHTLFTSRELAQQLADKIGGYVEEFQLWDELPSAFTVYERWGLVYAQHINNERAAARAHYGTPTPEQQMHVEVGPRIHSGDAHWLTVISTDRERVDKVWGERVAQLRAELVGL